MFDVDAPPPRVQHDGVSPIQVEGETVGAKHEYLWNLLVPSSGACKTVQGEVIRASGRIAGEWFRNGGANWDRDYTAMAEAFVSHVFSHTALGSDDLEACKEVVRSIRSDPDSSERLMVWAVERVEKNRHPIPLQPPTYRR